MHRRLALLIGSIGLFWVLAFNTGDPFFSNLAYLGTGGLILSWLWSRTVLAGIELRRFPSAGTSQVGQRIDEVFELRNHGRMPKMWLELTDYSTLPHHESSRVVANLRRGGRRRWQIRTQCRVRGHFMLGPMRVRSSDPLGLFMRELHLPARTGITVFPVAVDLPYFTPVVSDLSGDERIRLRTPVVTTNASSVRDYTPGDGQNRIHWLSSARRNRLIVKEFELDPSAHVQLFLDLAAGPEVSLPTPPPATGPAAFGSWVASARAGATLLPPSTTEYSIAASASVVRHFLRGGRAVGLTAYGQVRITIPPDRGGRQERKLLESLAVLEAEGGVSMAEFILNDGLHLSRHETLMVVTADPDPLWVQALRELRMRGVGSLALVVDCQTFNPDRSMQAVFAELASARLPHYRIAKDQPLAEALAGNPQRTWLNGSQGDHARVEPAHGQTLDLS